jgi:hypothetical protein
MDFATRDRYRHVVEEIAKGSELSENDVARAAIRLAFESAGNGSADERDAHVGYFLIGKGRPLLEQAARMRVSSPEALRRAARRFPLLLYVGAIATITAAVTAALLATATGAGVADGVLVIAGVLSAGFFSGAVLGPAFAADKPFEGVTLTIAPQNDQFAPVLAPQRLQRGAHHRGELAVGDQHPGFAVVHLPGQQRRVEPRVQRVQHRAQRRHGVMCLHHLGRVGQHHADGVAAADAQGAQCCRQPRRALAHLRPGVAALAVHHGRQVAEHLGAAFDEAHRAQRHVVGAVAVEVLIVDAHDVASGFT